jgi:hypothetical protein
MVWIIQPMERKDPLSGQGNGKWDLVARSDEGGGFHPCLPTSDHPGFDTAELAAADPVARAIAGRITGIARELEPYQQRVVDEKWELDSKIEKLMAFLAAPSPAATGLELLEAQLLAMRSYSEILGKRIGEFTGG